MEREDFGIKYLSYKRTNLYDVGCMIYCDTYKDSTFMIRYNGKEYTVVFEDLYIIDFEQGWDKKIYTYKCYLDGKEVKNEELINKFKSLITAFKETYEYENKQRQAESILEGTLTFGKENYTLISLIKNNTPSDKYSCECVNVVNGERRYNEYIIGDNDKEIFLRLYLDNEEITEKDYEFYEFIRTHFYGKYQNILGDKINRRGNVSEEVNEYLKKIAFIVNKYEESDCSGKVLFDKKEMLELGGFNSNSNDINKSNVKK